MNYSRTQKLDTFRHLYESYSSRLILFASRFVDKSTAEDLVHDVFIELWKQEELPTGDTAGSYLFRCVQNASLNFLRHQTIEEEYIAKASVRLKIMELERASMDEILIRREQVAAIHQAIQTLPDKCREIFEMHFFEEKKSSEIAAMLDLSVRTVETQIYKGLKTLRQIVLNYS